LGAEPGRAPRQLGRAGRGGGGEIVKLPPLFFTPPVALVKEVNVEESSIFIVAE
jgi:hypothetical protein